MRRRHLLTTLASVAVLACHRRRGTSLIDEPFAPPPGPAIPPETFRRWMEEAAEPAVAEDADNSISNETSYLHVAPTLVVRRRAPRAYLGVGPEQNLSYIALTRPALAFIVDYRRGNAIVHLLHKALFAHARSRAQYLAMLLSRPFEPGMEVSSHARIDAILAAVERTPPNQKEFVRLGALVRSMLEETFGHTLDERDGTLLDETRAVLARRQLDGKPTTPHGCSLRALLRATTRQGAHRSFLAHESAFRYVQAMHAEHRIVPIVGDFAGDHALRRVGTTLSERRLPLGTLYLSNVEQYLPTDRFKRWMDNARGLPLDDEALVVRSWLFDGRPHPARVAEHATLTVAQPATTLTGADDGWTRVNAPSI